MRGASDPAGTQETRPTRPQQAGLTSSEREEVSQTARRHAPRTLGRDTGDTKTTPLPAPPSPTTGAALSKAEVLGCVAGRRIEQRTDWATVLCRLMRRHPSVE